MSIELALLPIAIAAVTAWSSRNRSRPQGEKSFLIETAFADEKTLKEALVALGCQGTVSAEGVYSKLGTSRIIFARQQDSRFDALFLGDIKESDACRFVEQLTVEYGKLVQQEVYQRLLEKASQHGLVYEREEILADNSIVVTLQVQV